MVGSYQLAQISRSYIAIPGSKSDTDTKTILYDISLGSHLAITVSVPGNTSYTSNFTSHNSPCERPTFISNNSVNDLNARSSHITRQLTTKVTPTPLTGVQISNTDLQNLILENIDLKKKISFQMSNQKPNSS